MARIEGWVGWAMDKVLKCTRSIHLQIKPPTDGVNARKHFTALYKYENGELTICYNLMGNGYPESFDTKGKATYFLSVFKKSQ